MALTREQEEAVLQNGHPPVAEGVVCIDFDGTIAPFGDLFGFPKPLPGAKKFIDELKAQGYKVYIFTSRLSSVWHAHEGRNIGEGIFQQVEYLRAYCERYNINVDGATAEKIPAEAYIDDKAIEYLSWRLAKERFNLKTGKVKARREDA
jgi:hypothetical protein